MLKVLLVKSTLCLTLVALLHEEQAVQAQQGSCGAGAPCSTELCCSKWGYCGTGVVYCGSGCQAQYSGTGSACSGSSSSSSTFNTPTKRPTKRPSKAPSTPTTTSTASPTKLRTNAPTTTVAPSPTTQIASCTMFGQYTTALLQGHAACQNQLNKQCDPSSAVAAVTWANAPSYNAQCGNCIRVHNLDYPADVPQYVRIIDQGGGVHPPGIDLNEGIAQKFSGLIEKGNIRCSWEYVDSALCPWQ